MYPVIALIGLTVFMWVVAMWASFDDSEANHDVEKPEESPGENDHRKAA